MKKTNRIKAAALVLAVLMLVQLISMSGITSIAAAGTGVLYETEFNGDFSALEAEGLWMVEPSKRTPGSTKANAPDVSGGVMSFDSKDSVAFKWVDVEDLGTYSTQKQYVFEFDAKVTNSGTGFVWAGGTYSRTMYVAPGGWFNQIEINTTSNQIRTGDTYAPYSASDFEGKNLHFKVVLEGTTIASYIYREDGSLLSSGTRTNDSYANVSSTEDMKTFVIRCEDGAFEVDNFTFSVKSAPVYSQVSRESISIPSGKQAIYTAKINHVSGERSTVKLGSTELFDISSSGMKICGCYVTGSYGEGEYGVKLYINPTQKMLLAEITLPDGGIVRRGSHDKTSGSAVTVSSMAAENVSDVNVTYQSISVANYTVVDTEPTLSGFAEKAYNLVSSFSDASSDRLFAWTATSAFSNSGTMALKYREKGATEWSSVDATKCDEPTRVSAENYFKAEISNLKADTEYEYQIGKKDSVATDDWSKIYTFKTAPENVKEFTFVAIGDPQGYEWSDFKYAKVALDEAMEEVSNPAFIFNAGDVVDSGYQAYQWNRFFKAMGDYGATLPNFVAIGNHDTKNAANVQTNTDKNNYFAFHFNHPDAPENALVMDPADYNKLSSSGKVQVDNFDETLYSYNYGDVHFVVLNSGTYVNTGNETYPDDQLIFEAQRDWLISDLEANSDAKWTIVMLHEAIYHRKGGKQDRTYLADVIEEFGVDLVLEGHSHLVTRTYPMKDGEIVTKTSPDLIEKGTGTVYMTIGATTTGHDTLGDTNVEVMQTIITPNGQQPTYTTVSITESEITLTTKQVNGLVLDSFTIQGEEVEEEEETTPPTTEDTQPEESQPEESQPEVTEPEVTEPETTEPEVTEPEVTEPETTEPEVTTEAEEDEDTTKQEETKAPETTEKVEEKKGCGNSIGVAGLALVAALGTCTVFVAKKKKD